MRQPMLLEFGSRGRLRVSSIQTGPQGRFCRRTAWHGQYEIDGYVMVLVFSCRHAPAYWPLHRFQWNAEQQVWATAEDVVLEDVTPYQLERFTRMYTIHDEPVEEGALLVRDGVSLEDLAFDAIAPGLTEGF